MKPADQDRGGMQDLCFGCDKPIMPNQSRHTQKAYYRAWHLDCSPHEQEAARRKRIATVIAILCRAEIPARLEAAVSSIVSDLVAGCAHDEVESRLGICAEVTPEITLALVVFRAKERQS